MAGSIWLAGLLQVVGMRHAGRSVIRSPSLFTCGAFFRSSLLRVRPISGIGRMVPKSRLGWYVSVARASDGGHIVGKKSLAVNPCDGDSLKDTMDLSGSIDLPYSSGR